MTLTPEQQAVVDSNEPHIVVVAGPGSGKSRVLVERIKRLVRAGRDPKSMVAITYTNNAAEELQQRLEGIRLGFIGTLHVFMLRALIVAGQAVGLGPRVSVIDEDDASALLEQVASEMKYRGTKQDLEESVKRGCDPLSCPKTEADYVANRFYQTVRKHEFLTFDMILHYGLELLIKFAWPFQHEFLFVDEFQDANDVDAEIYNRLPIKNKFMVGDPDQAIFGFRGGKIEHILEAWESIKTEGRFTLEENFRSDRDICEKAGWLIEHNTGRVEKLLVPHSINPGVVNAEFHPNAQAEMQSVAIDAAEQLSNGYSVAILLRTRQLVNDWTAYLETAGVRVAKTERVERPSDWRHALNVLGFLHNPSNDLIACRLIERQKNAKAAETAKIKALALRTTVNAISFKADPVRDWPSLLDGLARLDVSRESIKLVQDAMDKLDPAAGVPELLVALNSKEERESVSQGIVITTMHAAKGREFDVVFCPAFEQGIIPSRQKDTDIEEERRLAFVAFTRARHELWVSWAEERKAKWDREPKPALPSQFIKEAFGQ